MNPESSFSRKLAIVLIVCAVFGTEISYHFTLESRFDAIEQNLQRDTVAMRTMQNTLDTLSSSKTQTLAGLNKQVEALQSSVEPIGKTTREQTDALAQVRQEIAALQQAQNQQLDAQKKLSSGITQLENLRNNAAHLAAVPVQPAVYTAPAPAIAAPTTPASTPVTAAPAPVALPASTPTAGSLPPANTTQQSLMQDPGAFARSSKIAMLPVTPNASEAVNVRQIDSSASDTFRSVRAFPVGSTITR